MDKIFFLAFCLLTLIRVKSGPITSPRNWTNWGDWGFGDFFKYPYYAIGLKSNVEPFVGTGDDTALNGISLLCTDGSNIVSNLATGLIRIVIVTTEQGWLFFKFELNRLKVVMMIL